MSPEEGPRIDDPVTHARTEMRRRLEAAGCTWIGDEIRTVHETKCRLSIHYMGRDEQGHLAQCKGVFEARPGELLEVVDHRIEKQLRVQERRFAIAGGIAPVVVGPDMPLSHLEVTLPYARRLRLDHGDNAQDALRQAIADRLAEMSNPSGRSVKAPNSKVANQPAFCGHRINHRERLGEGVWLRSQDLVIENTTLPQQIAIALVGRPVTAVCHHEVLADTETVREIEMSNADGMAGRRTATLRLDVQWIRANEI